MVWECGGQHQLLCCWVKGKEGQGCQGVNSITVSMTLAQSHLLGTVTSSLVEVFVEANVCQHKELREGYHSILCKEQNWDSGSKKSCR